MTMPRRRLPQSGWQDAPHIDAIDRIDRNARPLDRGLDCRRAQFGGLEARQGTLKPAHRRAGIAGDNYRIVLHINSFQRLRAMTMRWMSDVPS